MGELSTGNLQGEGSLAKLRNPQNAMLQGIKGMHFNTYSSTEISIIVQYDYDGGTFDLFSCPLDRIKQMESMGGMVRLQKLAFWTQKSENQYHNII